MDTGITAADAERLLFQEARLLDAHDYAAWLTLWTLPARYWVPGADASVGPERSVSLIDDDRDALDDRVFRMEHAAAHAHRPRSTLSRIVSNVEVSPTASGADVTSAYVLVAHRRHEQMIFGAHVEHRLVRTIDGLRIAAKTVHLSALDDALRNLTFLP